MPRLIHRVPKYRHHATGQAVVTLNGRDVYLGPHGTAASRREYDRLIQEWKSNNRAPLRRTAGDDFSIGELIHAYWVHCSVDMGPGDLRSLKLALRAVKELYVDEDVRDFGPLALRAIRDKMVASHDWSRRYVNKQVNRIRAMFKWGVGRELVGSSTWEALKAVEPLLQGKTKAREIDPITTIDDSYVEAVLPFLNRHLAAMVRIQQLTGCRPGELVKMRWVDIDTRNRRLWEYRPASHKTAHHGHDRVIYLNADAQAIIEEFRTVNLAAHVFSPAVAEGERRAAMTEKRKTPASCGNRPGSNRTRKPRKQPGQLYDVDSYRRAITRACDLANNWAKGGMIVKNEERVIPRWHPHQIRHNTATKLRAQHGLEAAQVILGHRTLSATQIYAERNVEKAKKIMQGGR